MLDIHGCKERADDQPGEHRSCVVDPTNQIGGLTNTAQRYFRRDRDRIALVIHGSARYPGAAVNEWGGSEFLTNQCLQVSAVNSRAGVPRRPDAGTTSQGPIRSRWSVPGSTDTLFLAATHGNPPADSSLSVARRVCTLYLLKTADQANKCLPTINGGCSGYCRCYRILRDAQWPPAPLALRGSAPPDSAPGWHRSSLTRP